MSAVALVPTAGTALAITESVRGMPLITRAVRGLHAAGRVRHVVVSAPAAAYDDVVLALAGEWARVIIADDRPVHACLDAALRDVPAAEFALVHDVARAGVPPEVIGAVLDELERGAPAVIPVLPLTDTVKQVDAEGRILATPDRENLRVLQAPLGVRVDILRAAASLTELGVPLTPVPGHPNGLLIRSAFDLLAAEALFSLPQLPQ